MRLVASIKRPETRGFDASEGPTVAQRSMRKAHHLYKISNQDMQVLCPQMPSAASILEHFEPRRFERRWESGGTHRDLKRFLVDLCKKIPPFGLGWKTPYNGR